MMYIIIYVRFGTLHATTFTAKSLEDAYRKGFKFCAVNNLHFVSLREI